VSVVPDSVLRVPTLSLLAIIVMRVAVLYRGAKWVVRGLWFVYAVLYPIAIVLAIFTIKSFYSQPILLGS
jgi:hypothetical protein